MNLTLTTYNIHRCIGSDGRYDPGRTIRVIKSLKSEVVALQEVENDFRTKSFLSYAAEETGMSWLAGPTLHRQDSHYGNALLTSARVLDVKNWDLSYPQMEPRGAIDASLDYKGFKFRVINTHLGLKSKERRWQIQFLLGLFKDLKEDISIFMGDVNEWIPWGSALGYLHHFFEHTRSPATFPTTFPLFPLDRIWVKPRRKLLSLEILRNELTRMTSDHFPLKAVVEV